MKFIILISLLACSSVLAAESDDLINRINNATEDLKHKTKDVTNQLIGHDAITTSINNAVNVLLQKLTEPVISAIKTLNSNIGAELNKSTALLETYQQCAKQSDLQIDLTLPFTELSQCSSQSTSDVEEVVTQVVDLIQESGRLVSETLSGALGCVGGFSFACWTSLGITTVANGLALGSKLTNFGFQTTTKILSHIPTTASCISAHTNNIVQNYTNLGINLATCVFDN